MINKGLMSSKKQDWATPIKLYRTLDGEFNFDFDPCPLNYKTDGLTIRWYKSNFVNPPYGTEIGKWVKKSYEESLKGNDVVMLIPARTDTKYWHDFVMKASEIRFIKGRLKFNDGKSPAPFPSCIVVFTADNGISPYITSVDVEGKEI